MKFKNYFKVLFIGVSLVFLNGFKTYSQQIYATTATEISEGERVDNVDNAAIIDSLFARVNSAGSYSGELKLEFPSTVPANSTAYIKVDDLGKGVLDFLLGGSLGDLLADAGGSTSDGDHYVEVSALDSIGEVVAVGDTDNLFNDSLLYSRVPLKVVKNKDGELFITITPTVAYNAIVIKDITETLQTVVSSSNFTNVYYAFYLDPTDTSCNSEEIFTSFDGTGITLDLLGLGVTGVKDLEFAIDNDSTSFSTISVGIISAEASMYQDIYFSTTATTEDILDLSIRPKSGFLVNAAVLQNITIELYKEEEVVFSQDLDAATILEADPNQDGEITNITVTPGVEFDRLRVTLTSPLGVNLEQQVDLFNVKVTPPPIVLPPGTEIQSFCVVPEAFISDLKATATGTPIWYDQETGGTAYAANTALEDGKIYYGANLTGTCESTKRLAVTVELKNPEKPEGEANQSFCLIDNPKIEDLIATVTTPPTAIAEAIVLWYATETGGTAYAPDFELKSGPGVYYAANSVEYTDKTCESSQRLKVTVELTDPEKPEEPAEQSFCLIDNPKIEDLIATVTTPPTATAEAIVIWYATETGGTAYAPDFELKNGPGVYYAANSVEYTDKTCESTERLVVTVTITDPEKPEGDANQSFCLIDNPKIENLIATVTTPSTATAKAIVIWYATETGGTAYAPDFELKNGPGVYYAANSVEYTDKTCESTERLVVTVTITDPEKPEGEENQSFCLIDNPKIENLIATVTTPPTATAEAIVIWYATETGGTAYAPDFELKNGPGVYYAANSVEYTDKTCESTERFIVTVTITDPEKPEGDANQNFCLIDNPKIENLIATVTTPPTATAEAIVIWYATETGGTAYAPDFELKNGPGVYYAANSVKYADKTCESTERLVVTVTLTNPEKPKGEPNQSFCVIDEPTIANLKATASGTIIWYNELTGGTAYATSIALEDGLKYYAANSDGTCESSERLEVSVVILDTNPPSGANPQTFCSTQDATIADLEATASGTITWYNQPTEGTAYANTDALANDFIYYAANSDGSCESSERFEVTVLITSATPISIEGKNTNVCFADIETYSVADGHAPYTWDISGGNLVSGGMPDDNEIEIEWTNITSAKVSVSLTGGCYSSNSAEQIVEVIVCSDLTIKNEVDFIKPKLEDTVTFKIKVENSDKTIFTDVIISEVLPSGFTFKSYTTSLGIYNPSNEIWNIPSLGANGSATLTLTAKVNTTGSYLNTASIIQSTPIDKDLSNNTAEVLVTPSCLEVYNIITPNGDGLNDNFVISCIDTYIGAVVEIYDRYGSIVYKKQNYTNDWNGVANQSGKIISKGEQIPNGTYFFILKFNDGSTENIKSYIQIKR
jgi:gliding motility-associated-like protein/uncharacterized repeat protein (TIGR01451 family)